jgi:hypothetical protein
MVEHLLHVHPAQRQRAADTTEHRSQIDPDDLKEAMARLALRLQEHHGGGYAPVAECRESLIAYLTDDVHGPGYPRGEARTRASQVLEDARTNLGILVERGADELGFLHLTLQEYLAAWAVSRKPLPEELSSVAGHWRDPAWREVLLALVGIHGVIRRDRARVAALVEGLDAETRSSLDSWRQCELLAEIVFSDLGLTPIRARALAEDILDRIERCPFRDLNGRLARAAVRGLRSEYVREVVARRVSVWFPARDPFLRAGLLQETASWQPSLDLRAALVLAIRDEDVRCRIATSEALAKVFADDSALGGELLVEASQAVRPEVREACLAGLAKRWPGVAGLADLCAMALKDRHAGVRLSGVLGRIFWAYRQIMTSTFCGVSVRGTQL